MARTVRTNELKPGDKIWVSGEVTYSRIKTKIEEGTPEYIQNNQRRMASGGVPANGSYYTITIKNPSFKTKVPNALRYENGQLVADVNNLTPMETYMYESMYRGKNDGVWKLTREIKGQQPFVGVMDMTSHKIKQVKPQGELASGSEVFLVFSVYKSKHAGNNGVGVDGVIAKDEIHYYSANSALSRGGFAGFEVEYLDPSELEDDTPTSNTQPAQLSAQPELTVQPQAPAYDMNNPIFAEDGANDVPW